MSKLLAIAFAVPLAAEFLDRVIAWARKRWQVQLPGDSCVPLSPGWIQWFRRASDDPEWARDLLIIRLPQWRYGPYLDWGNKEGWEQLELYWCGRPKRYSPHMPAGWHLEWAACE